jgi:hypothetical protein
LIVLLFPTFVMINELLVVNKLITFNEDVDEQTSLLNGVFYKTLLLVVILNYTSFLVTVFVLPIFMAPL